MPPRCSSASARPTPAPKLETPRKKNSLRSMAVIINLTCFRKPAKIPKRKLKPNPDTMHTSDLVAHRTGLKARLSRFLICAILMIGALQLTAPLLLAQEPAPGAGKAPDDS